MKRLITLLWAFCIVLCAVGCGAGIEPWQEQYDLGVRYLSEGNYEQAIIAFTQAIGIDPKQPAFYLKRANAYVWSGDTEENFAAAHSDYEQALALDGTLTDAWKGLIDLTLRQGNIKDAIELFQKALDQAEDPEQMRDELGRVFEVDDRSTYADGSHPYLWYEYDDAGNRIKCSRYRPDGTRDEETEYDSQGNPVRRNCYSEDGLMELSTVYDGVYDGQANTAEVLFYDEGQLQERQIWEYDKEGNLTLSKYNAEDVPLRIEEYSSHTNDSDAIKKDTFFNEDGSLDTVNEYKMNSEGIAVKNTCCIYSYTGGQMSGYTVLEYDQEGEFSKATAYFADGRVDASLTEIANQGIWP